MACGRRPGAGATRLLPRLLLATALLACGANDAGRLVCSGGTPGDLGSARAPREAIEWPAQAICRGDLRFAVRAPATAQRGIPIVLATRFVNEAAVERVVRYTVALLDEDGLTTLVRSQDTAVTIPAGGLDERTLTLLVPESTPPGAYTLRVTTGHRRRLGTHLEPLQITQRIAISAP